MTEQIVTQPQPTSMEQIERVLIAGDLSKLNASEKVMFYKNVCQSLGLNPLTKPFDFLTLNDKMVLYVKKDATDQLRKLHGVCIDNVDLKETAETFIATVKGHDATGRSDVELGVVNKSAIDKNGKPYKVDQANAQMKALTKAKRRLTLSLCGLGWLDETELETIPGNVRVSNFNPPELQAPAVDISADLERLVTQYGADAVMAANNGNIPASADEIAAIDLKLSTQSA
jgi:hypothetical protein